MPSFITKATMKDRAAARAQGATRLLMLACLLGLPPLLPAQVSSNEIGYFSRCRHISEVQERAACYDELYDRAVQAATPQDNSARLRDENRRMREELARIQGREGRPAPGASVTYGGNTPVAPGGYGRETTASRDEADAFGKTAPYVVRGKGGKDELVGRIAMLQKGQTGWIVTLDKGQVWRQMISKNYLLHEGQQVRIYSSMWGKAYRLAAEDTPGYIQVERVK